MGGMECTGEDAPRRPWRTWTPRPTAAAPAAFAAALAARAGRAARPTAGPSFPSPGAAPSDDAPSHRSGNIEGRWIPAMPREEKSKFIGS
eukprot:31061-Pelagococcus_subviridis.AAC.5